LSNKDLQGYFLLWFYFNKKKRFSIKKEEPDFIKYQAFLFVSFLFHFFFFSSLKKSKKTNLNFTSKINLAKFLTEIPLALLKPFLFGVVVYFMSGLQATVEKFFIFILTLCLTTLSSQGMGFAIRFFSFSIFKKSKKYFELD